MTLLGAWNGSQATELRLGGDEPKTQKKQKKQNKKKQKGKPDFSCVTSDFFYEIDPSKILNDHVLKWLH